MWKDKYKPRSNFSLTLFGLTDSERRNRLPWIIIMSATLFNALLLLAIRWTLHRRNKKRDAEPYDDTYDNVYLERLGKDGKMERVKIDKAWNLYY
jgi:hypothetical protein